MHCHQSDEKQTEQQRVREVTLSNDIVIPLPVEVFRSERDERSIGYGQIKKQRVRVRSAGSQTNDAVAIRQDRAI